MFVRDYASCDEFIAGDQTRLRELFNPLKDPLELRYSFAIAAVEPGQTTALHRLKNSEVYFILDGEGEMAVDDEREKVRPGQAVYVPPGAQQCIANTGESVLSFICIVDPAWRAEDEEILSR